MVGLVLLLRLWFPVLLVVLLVVLVRLFLVHQPHQKRHFALLLLDRLRQKCLRPQLLRYPDRLPAHHLVLIELGQENPPRCQIALHRHLHLQAVQAVQHRLVLELTRHYQLHQLHLAVLLLQDRL